MLEAHQTEILSTGTGILFIFLQMKCFMHLLIVNFSDPFSLPEIKDTKSWNFLSEVFLESCPPDHNSKRVSRVALSTE